MTDAGPRDVMDGVHDRWRDLRPDLDVSALPVIGRVNRLARIVQRRSDDLLAEFGLGRADFDLLAALTRRDAPTSPTQLADETLLSPPAVTKRVKGLLAAGLVDRSANPADHRGYFVAPTTAGRRLIDRVLEVQLADERAILADLPEEAHATVADGLRQVLITLEG
ncbi:MarR family winged helix-turn-helix transcriptional regulator [Frigoribacterium sp. VKM Ac-2836]|uniref:MarR family winged helix-turn-helix transcriptional regulator n=1 Tax=Frigoribacterium sp. VKM Ac-2836 TaxID=2739014 RepID=UPI001567C5C6|nr:MarR family transcriptional regulator [Frigoribacterium sp. VKM Ac-2836]NRD26890.1 MarR family transcriptional regulator [Frigoribacterium sp. VKM Ac-2836]